MAERASSRGTNWHEAGARVALALGIEGGRLKAAMARASLLVIGIGAIAFGLACSTTTGASWVRQPEPGPFEDQELATSAHHFEAFDEPRTSSFVSDAERDPSNQPRPRLDRTVTLGEVFTGTSQRAEVAPAPSGAPVNVTVNNYSSSPSGYYDGYFAAPVIIDEARRGRPNTAPRPTQPGQDWPKLPSYGPAFPYKTVPADPWR